ncbi:MAG: cytochrome C biogenesis protein CcmF [Deltaproteobacteria bacterium]|nr:cytochrome C biogenesis protein CcmF [Deltaproteobacteria bacterium]
MISILGRGAVLLALAACSVGTITGAVAAIRGSASALRTTRVAAYVFGCSLVLATLLMEVALLTHDFSVSYVAEVGSLNTPTWVTIVSLWSSLNGSILLWGFVLALCVMGLAYNTRGKYPDLTPWALSVAMGVGVFFTFLIAGVANPFSPMSPVPTDGPGPNPLLQNHILMVVHPPMLYLGYVGMTIPFAMGAAALLAGRLDAAWTRLLRRWMLIPWGFLSVGIILGGWWSYEVLGWGGWWAWDPVENASFLPWLTATAFVHSAMVMERKSQLKGWTLALVFASFLLTLLGTFMTRSGVFNSVHSFTQSPIGPVFLGFLAIATIFCVLLMAFRLDALGEGERPLAMGASRDLAFLANNLLFTAFTFMVLLGTVYPLLNEAVTETQISVGQPYFDRMGAPLGVAILFLMGVGPALPWGSGATGSAVKRLIIPLGTGVLAVVLSVALGITQFWPLLTFGLAGFAFATTMREIFAPAMARSKARGEGLGIATWAVVTRARRRFGGYVVHVGVISIAVAHAASMAYQTKTPITLVEGQSAEVSGYELAYLGSAWEEQPHRTSLKARFEVSRDGASLGVLEPRLNHYKKMGTPIGTPVVKSRLTEDLYLSLINVDPTAKTASLDVMIHPMVMWLWVGGAFMLIGTVVAVWPSRSRARAAAKSVPAPVSAAPGK